MVLEEGDPITSAWALIEGVGGESVKNKETADNGSSKSRRPSRKGSDGGAGADTGSNSSQCIVVD